MAVACYLIFLFLPIRDNSRLICNLIIMVLGIIYGCAGGGYVRAAEPRAMTATIRLQIVSEVYKKQPYIQVPSAWILPTVRLELFQKIEALLQPTWQVQEISVKEEKDVAALRLKCHPAANIEISTKNPTKSQAGLLLLYPQSYRGLIEDPLAENPPPIVYLGSAQRVAFYYFPKNKINSEVVDKITTGLKLKK